MKPIVPALLSLGLTGVLLACGGSSALPETEACPSPTATPTARGGGGASFLYRRVASDGDRQLTALLDRFRSDYPEDTFYRRDTFRPDFAGWAAAAKCVTANMRAINAPSNNEALKTFDATLEGILVEYDGVVDKGSEAVRIRNTSDYKDFYRRMDAITGRLREHMSVMP